MPTPTTTPKAINREFYLSDDDRDYLEAVAAGGGTTVTGVVRAIVEEILDDEQLAKQLSTLELDQIAGRDLGRLAVRFSHEVWQAFGDVAWRMRSTRSKLLRAYISDHRKEQ